LRRLRSMALSADIHSRTSSPPTRKHSWSLPLSAESTETRSSPRLQSQPEPSSFLTFFTDPLQLNVTTASCSGPHPRLHTFTVAMTYGIINCFSLGGQLTETERVTSSIGGSSSSLVSSGIDSSTVGWVRTFAADFITSLTVSELRPFRLQFFPEPARRVQTPVAALIACSCHTEILPLPLPLPRGGSGGGMSSCLAQRWSVRVGTFTPNVSSRSCNSLTF